MAFTVISYDIFLSLTSLHVSMIISSFIHVATIYSTSSLSILLLMNTYIASMSWLLVNNVAMNIRVHVSS